MFPGLMWTVATVVGPRSPDPPTLQVAGRRGVFLPKALRHNRVVLLVLAIGMLAGCTGPPEASPAPDVSANPVAFCGYLDRPAVAQAIASYLGAADGGSPTGALHCGDAKSGGPLSRGGWFTFEGQSQPSVVVSLDILSGGLPDKALASEARIDDDRDPKLRAWCGVLDGPVAGEVNAFRSVPGDTLPVDMTANQPLVVTVQIRRYPGGTCTAGWTLFKDLAAAGALDEKQFARA
jgi:hypothetical protein